MPGGDSSGTGGSKLSDEDLAKIVAALQASGLWKDETTPRTDKEGKRYWKTSDVGYFWPDMPLHCGAGRVVDYDGSRYFRDVNSFVAQVQDSVTYYTAEVVRNNLQNCLKGQAFSWYSDIVPAATKKQLRQDNSDTCSFWTDTLVENFKRSGAQAMDRIASEQTRYTMQMLKSGASLVSWFTDMISLATDAEFTKDDQKLRFVWHKMDAELRDRAPELKDSHTIQTYLNALRNAEESIREAVRAQDRRISSQMRPDWRYPQNARPAYYDRDGHQQRPFRPYIPPPENQLSTTVSTTARQDTASRNFSQYIPEAFKKPEALESAEPRKFNSDDKGKGKDVGGRYGSGSRPSWASGPLAPRRDAFRVNPKRDCRYCGGYHYDSMCRKRMARTPRVYYNEMSDIYTVETTGDDEYDQDQQEFVSAYFSQGYSIDDFYRLCDTWQDYRTNDIVECGLAEATTDTQAHPLKSNPTTALLPMHAARLNYSNTAFHTRFSDTTMKVPTPKASSKDDGQVRIHHTQEEEVPQHQCQRCPAKFRKRNRLFQHLRTTNHYMSTDVFATPNDPKEEHDPDVVKSEAVATFGTGYSFRTFNYLEMSVRLDRHGPDTWVCLDTGAGMSLIDREWLNTMCPDANILTRASGVSVRGIDNKSQQTSSYVVLQLYVPAYEEKSGVAKLAEIRREFHIVSDLRCKMIVGEDIIEPEGIVIDSQHRTAWIKSCGGLRFKLQITPKGRQVLHRRVRTAKKMSVPPGSRTMIPIKCKPLPDNRDLEFTPVYDSKTAQLGNAGGFLRAIVDGRTDSVIFHNRSCDAVVIPKDTKIGYIADLTADAFHTQFDPDEHPELFDCAENGLWKKGAIAAVSILACSAASRMFGGAAGANKNAFEIKNAEIGIEPRAGPNTWTTGWSLPKTGDGYGSSGYQWAPDSSISDGYSLGDEIYQMTTTANDMEWTTPVGAVDINKDDEILPSQYEDIRALASRYADLFEDKGTVANEKEDEYMKIVLKPGAELPNKGPYNNSAKDRKVIDFTFDGYHKQNKMGWTPQGVKTAWPAFVVWQKDKGRVVTDIRGLNSRVWKDPYPMPRQEDILQAIKGCHWISTLDLTAAFMQRTLHPDSRHLVTVVTHRGLEYFKVVPFGFTNSPAHMQRFMDGRLRNLRTNVRCYIDDIVIHSRTFEDHLRHLKDVFEVLREAGLYLSPKKCHLAYHSVTFLGRVVNSLGLSTIRERAEAIQSLSFPTTLQQLESFIGSANYNRTHIPHYASLIAPLEHLKRELLRSSPAKGSQRKRYTSKFRLDSPTEAQRISFQAIKDTLSGPTMLVHYDNKIPLIIRMDASKERGYGATVTQIPAWSFDEEKRASTVLDPNAEGYDIKMERPICYLSKRLNKHEMNYWPTELEVAGLVWTIRKIRHLVDDSENVCVFTDHQATKGIAAQENFRHSAPHRQNLRLVRASLYLSQFPQVKIFHVPGKLNVVPDALSRLQSLQGSEETGDDEDIYDALQLQATMLRVSDELIDKFQRGYAEDPFYKTKFAEMKRQFAKQGSLPVEYNNLVLEDAEVNAFTPPAKEPLTINTRRYLLYLKDGDRLRLCIPRSLYAPFLEMAHDRHNHAGFDRAYQRLRHSYFMKGSAGVIRDYIRHCPSCLLNKPNNYTPSGKLIPIAAPSAPWELVTMDFVVKLPPCTPRSGLWAQLVGKPDLPTYDSFLTITDKLTKFVMIVPGCENWDAKRWALAYFEEVFPIFGVPAAMISDRGSVFVSLFWTTIFSLMKTDCIATTAYNPRADGQSERTNQVVEIALRHVVNDHQDDWVSFLGEVRFAMNNSPNAATGKTPSELLMGFYPRGIIDIPTGHIPRQGGVSDAYKRGEQIKVLRNEAQDAIKLAEFTMAATYDNAHRIADIRPGDYVFINFSKKTEAGYSASGIQSRKLGPQRAGPFLVIAMAGENACKVDIPADWKIWPVISVRHLTKAPSTPDVFSRPSIRKELRPDDVVHEVEEVLDVRMMNGRKEYFIKYVGLPLSRCEWTIPDKIEGAREKIEEFDRAMAARSLGLPGKRKREAEKLGAQKKR
jgi:hypothetical protein